MLFGTGAQAHVEYLTSAGSASQEQVDSASDDDEDNVYRPGFDETNIMARDGSSARQYLAEGQIFRGHYADYSMLNKSSFLTTDSGTLRGSRVYLNKMQAWHAAEHFEAPAFGEYPPACWRIWRDGDFPASSPNASIYEECPKRQIPITGLLPNGIYYAQREERFPKPTFRRAARAMRLLIGDCRAQPEPKLGDVLEPGDDSELVFRSFAQEGPDAFQRRWIREQAQAAAMRARDWATLPSSRSRVTPRVLSILQNRDIGAAARQGERRFADRYRIMAMRALLHIGTESAKSTIREIASGDGRVAQAARELLGLAPD